MHVLSAVTRQTENAVRKIVVHRQTVWHMALQDLIGLQVVHETKNTNKNILKSTTVLLLVYIQTRHQHENKNNMTYIY